MKAVNRRRVLGRALAGSSDKKYLWEAARRVYNGPENLTSVLIKEGLFGIAVNRPGIGTVLGDGPFKRLIHRHSETAASNLILLKAYDEIADVLTRYNLRFVPVKGCDLVGTLYDDPGERPMTDIDILVHPDDFGLAVNVAAKLGYADINYRFRLPGVWPSTTMYGEIGGFSGHLDLHYCPGPEIGRRRLETRRLFTQWEPGKRPTDEQRLLFSLIHHQNHFFDTPLADLYEFLMLAERVDADAFKELARRWDVVTAASVVFGQIAYFFGVNGPIDGLRRPVIGEIINKSAGDPAGINRFWSAITFTLSADRPTETVKFGIRLVLKKYKNSRYST
jgi:hypothetical protein